MRMRHIAISGALVLAVTACAAPNEAAPRSQDWPFTSQLKCGGTEPFWSLVLTPGNGAYHPIDGADRSFALTSSVRLSGIADFWSIEGHDEASKQAVSLTLQKTDQCSDGMSDFIYDYEIALSQGSQRTLWGCCGRKE